MRAKVMFDHERKRLARQALIKAQRIRTRYKINPADPLNPIDIAEKCGCEVRFMPLASLEGIYAPFPRPVIILGSERPYGRRSFNCAHELGHHLFKHGTRFEELNKQILSTRALPEEFVVDMFAGFLLLPQFAINKALKDREWIISLLKPEQIYKLASFFGVGYSTVINHLTWSLKMMDRIKAKSLLKYKPKQIKAIYNTDPASELFFVDEFWCCKPVDLEIGDSLVVPKNIYVDSSNNLVIINENESITIYQAIKTGYSHAYSDNSDWVTNIRISRKSYEGLAQYRFLESDEEDSQ